MCLIIPVQAYFARGSQPISRTANTLGHPNTAEIGPVAPLSYAASNSRAAPVPGRTPYHVAGADLSATFHITTYPVADVWENTISIFQRFSTKHAFYTISFELTQAIVDPPV